MSIPAAPYVRWQHQQLPAVRRPSATVCSVNCLGIGRCWPILRLRRPQQAQKRQEPVLEVRFESWMVYFVRNDKNLNGLCRAKEPCQGSGMMMSLLEYLPYSVLYSNPH